MITNDQQVCVDFGRNPFESISIWKSVGEPENNLTVVSTPRSEPDTFRVKSAVLLPLEHKDYQ
jgi:hypothetical protein